MRRVLIELAACFTCLALVTIGLLVMARSVENAKAPEIQKCECPKCKGETMSERDPRTTLSPAERQAILGQRVRSMAARPARVVLDFGYRPKCDRGWFLRLVAKHNLRREAERLAEAEHRNAQLAKAVA